MATAEITHPALMPDIPGAVSLTQYSRDAERAYALMRDTLAHEYRTAVADLVTAAEVFDATGDPDEVMRARDGLERLQQIAHKLRDLEPPDGMEDTAAELATFRADLRVRTRALGNAFEAADQYLALQHDQCERHRILEENKETGRPFYTGLPDHLVTADDADAIPGFWDPYTTQDRSMIRWRLGRQQKRLADDTPFSLSESLTESAKNIGDSVHAFERAQAASQRRNNQPAEPIRTNAIDDATRS